MQVGSFRALRKVAQVVLRCVEMGSFPGNLGGLGVLGAMSDFCDPLHWESLQEADTQGRCRSSDSKEGNTRMDAEWRTQWVKDSGGWVRGASASVD